MITLKFSNNMWISEDLGIPWLERLENVLDSMDLISVSKAEIMSKFIDGLEFKTPEEVWLCAMLVYDTIDKYYEENHPDLIAEMVLRNKNMI